MNSNSLSSGVGRVSSSLGGASHPSLSSGISSSSLGDSHSSMGVGSSSMGLSPSSMGSNASAGVSPMPHDNHNLTFLQTKNELKSVLSHVRNCIRKSGYIECQYDPKVHQIYFEKNIEECH